LHAELVEALNLHAKLVEALNLHAELVEALNLHAELVEALNFVFYPFNIIPAPNLPLSPARAEKK